MPIITITLVDDKDLSCSLCNIVFSNGDFGVIKVVRIYGDLFEASLSKAVFGILPKTVFKIRMIDFNILDSMRYHGHANDLSQFKNAVSYERELWNPIVFFLGYLARFNSLSEISKNGETHAKLYNLEEVKENIGTQIRQVPNLQRL